MTSCIRQGKRAKVILSNITNVYKNLALEHWILNNWSFDKFDCLLIYRNTPCVVVGRFQNVWREVNVDRARKEGSFLEGKRAPLSENIHETLNLLLNDGSYIFTKLSVISFIIGSNLHNFAVCTYNDESVNTTDKSVLSKHYWFSGVNVARRVSGGGAVYHDLGNVNFSFFTDKPSHCPPRNLTFLSREFIT